MPTAGRATGAILFAALGFAIAILARSGLPESVPQGGVAPVAALFGALLGWRMVGARAGGGVVASAGLGVTTSAAVAFWTLLFGATWTMLRRSTRGRYADPVEALGDVGALMLEYGAVLARVDVLILLVGGAAVAGCATELVSRRLS